MARLAALVPACLALAACDRVQGPPVTGGEPRLIHEVVNGGGGRFGGSSIATAHYIAP